MKLYKITAVVAAGCLAAALGMAQVQAQVGAAPPAAAPAAQPAAPGAAPAAPGAGRGAGAPGAPGAPGAAPAGRGGGRGGGAPAVVSPQVNPDGGVTFRIRAPNALAVTLSLEPGVSAATLRNPATPATTPPMTKDAATGVWSTTTPPLRPDVYAYRFNIDGVQTPDLGNNGPMKMSNNPGLGQSQVVVPGNPPEPWERTDVPHGAVAEHLFRSAAIGADRNYFVYTPPGYDGRRARRYPVLYLLHGIGERADGWFANARAHLILDNLIAQGKITPFILVSPLGFGATTAQPGQPAPTPGQQSVSFETFKTSLLTEIIPQVERNYNASPNKADRAIGGLSMGGAEALWIGLNNPDKFSYVAGFSSALVMLSGVNEVSFPRASAAMNSQFRLVYITCGTEDGLIAGSRSLRTLLEGKGMKVDYRETPGGHNFSVWKRNLIDFAPLLFR